MIRDRSVFIVNSANRLSGTPSNFQIRLYMDHAERYEKVCLLSAVVAKTYYQVQDGSNQFTLQEGSSTAVITIPIGTYTRDVFALVLTNLLNAASPTRWTYTVTYPNIRTGPETGLYTIKVSGNGTSQPQFIFASDNIHRQMGFHPNKTYSFSGGTLVSDHVCNFSSDACIFLHSDICYNSISQDNILQEVYTAGVPYNSYINYTNFSPEFNSKNLINHNQIYNFTLTDENNAVLDMNGVDSIFTIMIWKSNRFQSLVEKYIRYKTNKNTQIEEDDS